MNKKIGKKVATSLAVAVSLVASGSASAQCDIGNYNTQRKAETNIGAKKSSLSNAGYSLVNVLRDATIGGIDSKGAFKNPGAIKGPLYFLGNLVTLHPLKALDYLAGTVQSVLDIPVDAVSGVYGLTLGNIMPNGANRAVNSGLAGLQEGMDGSAEGRLFSGNDECIGADAAYSVIGLGTDAVIGYQIHEATKSKGSSPYSTTAKTVCGPGFTYDPVSGNCI